MTQHDYDEVTAEDVRDALDSIERVQSLLGVAAEWRKSNPADAEVLGKWLARGIEEYRHFITKHCIDIEWMALDLAAAIVLIGAATQIEYAPGELASFTATVLRFLSADAGIENAPERSAVNGSIPYAEALKAVIGVYERGERHDAICPNAAAVSGVRRSSAHAEGADNASGGTLPIIPSWSAHHWHAAPW